MLRAQWAVLASPKPRDPAWPALPGGSWLGILRGLGTACAEEQLPSGQEQAAGGLRVPLCVQTVQTLQGELPMSRGVGKPTVQVRKPLGRLPERSSEGPQGRPAHSICMEIAKPVSKVSPKFTNPLSLTTFLPLLCSEASGPSPENRALGRAAWGQRGALHAGL